MIRKITHKITRKTHTTHNKKTSQIYNGDFSVLTKCKKLFMQPAHIIMKVAQMKLVGMFFYKLER